MKEIKAIDYSIWIGGNSLSKLDISNYSKVAILVDENTKRDCLYKLPKIENALIIEIKSGEEYKNISTCNFIWEQLTINNFDRNSLLINLGGGVIGDFGKEVEDNLVKIARKPKGLNKEYHDNG